jgi:rhodanese-related sulfurtransferase
VSPPLAVHAWQLELGLLRPAWLLDLRPAESFARGHLRGARNLPYEQLQADALALIGPPPHADDAVLLIDAAGARAAEMAVWLRSRGVPARYLEGGMASWTGPLAATQPAAPVEGTR